MNKFLYGNFVRSYSRHRKKKRKEEECARSASMRSPPGFPLRDGTPALKEEAKERGGGT